MALVAAGIVALVAGMALACVVVGRTVVAGLACIRPGIVVASFPLILWSPFCVCLALLE